MLKIAGKQDIDRIISFCANYPIGTRISCGLLSYGCNYDFFKVWYSENGSEINAAVSIFGKAATVVASDGADGQEITEFLLRSGCDSICTDVRIFDDKNKTVQTEEKQLYIFSSCQEKPIVPDCPEKMLKNAYGLICSLIPNSFDKTETAYLNWLSDLTYRRSRGLARIKAVCGEKEIFSCAMTAAESKKAAIISGVACRKQMQGTGLGKKTVLALAGELVNEGKTVYVIALNDSAGAFYEKIGFKKYGSVFITKINYK